MRGEACVGIGLRESNVTVKQILSKQVKKKRKNSRRSIRRLEKIKDMLMENYVSRHETRFSI